MCFFREALSLARGECGLPDVALSELSEIDAQMGNIVRLTSAAAGPTGRR